MSSRFLFSILLCFFILLLWLPLSSYAESDDAFMDAMNAELGKVDASTETTGVNKRGNGGKKLSQAEFEDILQEYHSGSYRFYLKLPLHMREELYESYLQGTSFRELRVKIMDRYLKR
jgi:hypothetical protein